MRKTAFAAIILCCIMASGFAQQVKRYFFTHYTTTNGLLSNQINSIVQDEQGYFWIATTNGLQRFDGHSFISFRNDPRDPYSIPENEVWDVKIDMNKNLWVVFAKGKAGIFNTRTFRYSQVKVDIADDLILRGDKRLVFDSKGNVMLLTPKLSLLTYNRMANEFSAKYNFIPLPEGWMPSAITEDAATGKFYMAADSGLIVFNAKTRKFSYRGHNVENDPVIAKYGHVPYTGCPYIDKKHRLWFQNWFMAGSAAMFCYDLNNRKIVMDSITTGYILRGYNEIKTFTEQSDGRLLISGTPMLAEYSEAENIFIPIHNSLIGTLSSDFMQVIFSYSDSEENIWLCTKTDGIYKFNPSEQIFTTISHTNPHTHSPGVSSVMTFTETDNGDILSSAWGEGIMRYDSNLNPVPLKFKGWKDPNGLTGWSMCVRRDGKIWIGLQQDEGNIMVYDQVTHEAIQQKVFERVTIRQLAEDAQGNMWVGTHNMGLYKWTPGHANFEDGFSKIDIECKRVNAMLIDSSGFLWVSAPPYGVYKINTATGRVEEHLTSTSKPALPTSACGPLLQYNDSLMLIESYGLVIFNTKTKQLSHLSTNEGLPSPYIRSMLKDDAGYVWLGMNTGLCRLDLFKRSILLFDRDDGMANDNFTLASAFRLRDGRMLFGSNRDFVVFDPKNIRDNPRPPSPHITEFRLSGRSLQLDSLYKLDAVELAHDNTSVIIDFSALSYLQTNKFSYHYMLEGVDKDWVHAEMQPRATYPYLGPGTYRFKVRTRNSDGVYSANITELVIHVNAPFWQTWWFYSLLALACALVLFWLDRERMKRKEAIQRMRSNIAGNLHQDINTALNNINILSEMARRKADNEIHKSKEFIEQIHTKSRNMIVAMDDMLWSIDPQNDSMSKTVLRFKEYIAELNNRYGVNIEMSMEETIKALKLGMQFRHDVFILFKEITEGVLKLCPGNCKIVVGTQKHDLVYTMETRNHGCDNQQLKYLLQRQDIAERLSSLHATNRVIALKETSVLELVIPFGSK